MDIQLHLHPLHHRDQTVMETKKRSPVLIIRAGVFCVNSKNNNMPHKRQNHPDLKSARKAVYDYFENNGYVFNEGSKSYLSQAIMDYAAKHNEVLMAQMRCLQDSLTRKK